MQNVIDILSNHWKWVLPLAVVLIVVIIFLVRKGHLSEISIWGFKLKLGGSPKIPDLFARSDSGEFAIYFDKIVSKARRVVLIGTGINILHRDPIFLKLTERCKEGSCELEVYAANPFSPMVEARLIEEEAGDPKPRIGKKGIINWINTMLEKQESIGDERNFIIKLFSHYPTFALFIIDDSEYLFYPYGYRQLGNLSPINRYLRKNGDDQPMINFLKGQYRRIKASSVDAKLIFDLKNRKDIDVSKLYAFAIYLIPEAKSSLYKFGSKILGYDIREKHSSDSPWASFVGTASEFGFHLTVADAIYAASPQEIKHIQKEIEMIAQDIIPFTLTNLNVNARFPSSQSIALTCYDESGALEALHFEMVFRCYRRAIASNYSLGAAKIDRDSSQLRAKFMINRYYAPYILNQFKPHFTLLTQVPSDKMEQISNEITNLFDEMVLESEVEIKGVALMIKPTINKHWEIAKEIYFG